MKAQFVFLSIVIMCSFNTIAQTNFISQPIQNYVTANKTTAAESRLISIANWLNDNGTITQDSIYFTYSPNNGWDPVVHIKFDTAMFVGYNGNGYEPTNREIIVYDAQKHATMKTLENYAGNGFVPHSRSVYLYDVDGYVSAIESEYYKGNAWQLNSKTLFAYDAQKRRTEITNQSAGSGTLHNDLRTVIAYNAQGKIETETEYTWTNGQWEAYNRSRFLYTGANNTITVMARYETSSWVDKDSTLYAYDGNGFLIETEIKHVSSGVWKNSSKSIYTRDAAGNMTSDIYQKESNGNYENLWQIVYTYNSFNQPLSYARKSWDAAVSQFRDSNVVSRYYYEEFTSNVKDVTAVKAGTMNVYPIPANNNLTLNLKWNETQNATILLFDMTGKVAGKWTTPSATQHTQSLDISNVPSGTYILKVMGTKGTMHQQVNIVR